MVALPCERPATRGRRRRRGEETPRRPAEMWYAHAAAGAHSHAGLQRPGHASRVQPPQGGRPAKSPAAPLPAPTGKQASCSRLRGCAARRLTHAAAGQHVEAQQLAGVVGDHHQAQVVGEHVHRVVTGDCAHGRGMRGSAGQAGRAATMGGGTCGGHMWRIVPAGTAAAGLGRGRGACTLLGAHD